MASTIHSNARTTPQIRRELQEAPPGVSDPELARRYGISRMTVRKRAPGSDLAFCPGIKEKTGTDLFSHV